MAGGGPTISIRARRGDSSCERRERRRKTMQNNADMAELFIFVFLPHSVRNPVAVDDGLTTQGLKDIR